jgi:hypothetical protein
MTQMGDSFDQQERLGWARQALRDAAAAAAKTAPDDEVPADLSEPGGWRWRVLDDLAGLSKAVNRDYETARERQKALAWESRLGRLATGGAAAVGSAMSAAGVGLTKTSAVGGWILVVVGVVFAFAGSVFSANNYVRNRGQRLRFLRLLHDIWDFAYLVLPTAQPADAYAALGAIRTQWETAGG